MLVAYFTSSCSKPPLDVALVLVVDAGDERKAGSVAPAERGLAERLFKGRLRAGGFWVR
jgi:hypothetical protein